MDIKAYLSRIQLDRQEPDLAYLKQLQYKHLHHIPFENFDVLRREPIYLNLERIYEKIVNRHRGGFCYEVNGLFNWLLQELGYDTHLIGATVMRPSGEFAKKETHLAIIVQMDVPYLVDVGFGHAQLQPLTLDGAIHRDLSGSYRVKKLGDQLYDLERQEEEGWRILYRFLLEKRELIDFHEGIVYNQVSRESSFTHHELITMPTARGRITIRDHHLTETIHGEKFSRELSQEERRQLLRNTFKLHIDSEGSQ